MEKDKKDKKKKEELTMAEITAGYEEFIKGKELNENGKELFEQTLKKAANADKKPKPPVSK